MCGWGRSLDVALAPARGDGGKGGDRSGGQLMGDGDGIAGN